MKHFPRIRWAGALLGAALLALTGCGDGDGGGGGGQDGKVALTYRLWDEQQKAGYEKVIANFEKANPGIDVSIELLPWDQYWTKLTADAVAGTAPDVFWMAPSQFPEYVTKGVLADVAPAKIDASKYHQTVVQTFTYEGKLYGVPKDWGIVGLFYNKDLFKKAGVEMPDKLTWKPDGSGTFLETARKLTVDAKGKHPGESGFDPASVKTYGFASWNHYQTQWMNWVASNGGKLLDKPFGKYAFNDDASVQALQFGVDLVNKHHVSPPATQTNPPSDKINDMFKAGQVAMFPANNALLPFVAPELSFELGIAPMPEGPAGRAVNLNGLAEAVYAKSDHPAEAMKLAAYLGSAEAQKVMADGGYVFPALDGLAQGYVDYWKTKKVDVEPFLEQSRGTTFALPVTTGFTAFETKLVQIFNEMYLGKITPKQAADQAVTTGNATVK
ncbi:ABC transporter substrate-binding protein [Bailinhaonella thermotolerans]|uniref:Sugar ABC transporter substrate-binding protein n=1 Tax=Bailinhaonella thermotolerans TaxID=1070861 RepID=A0A3A4AY85_9ACTN|nr:sugar ABC transporter substrate-binding protein [Bailinhaonella thermotolerans]RJL35632.1 sugar ABC transporter substrate-binding protein [Bailinhaonella thermotolerans]